MLYSKSKVHEKKDKTAEEYEFEKNFSEMSFKPKINNYSSVKRGIKMLGEYKVAES